MTEQGDLFSQRQPPAEEKRKIFKVSELTRLIRVALENEFGTVWVEGELSNVHKHSSGHIYFTLKDESSQIAGAWFRGAQAATRLEIKDGIKVRILGEVTAYEARSQYQLIVRKMEEAGKGSLQEAFEALKKKLAAEGLFDASRKKSIPLLPQHIGIVTSPTGAAIRDILNILSRRFPNLHILIAPVKVQGEGAAQEIAGAIDLLNQRGGLDVLIVGRGGGSLEDLWAFNEEPVARAIARSSIPVISAVGHEVDFTISDFVADLRAPTPSAAAELVVGRRDEFLEKTGQLSLRLARSLRTSLLELKNRLLRVSRSYVFHEPRNLVRQYLQRLDNIQNRMTTELRDVFQDRMQRSDQLALRLGHVAKIWLNTSKQDLERLGSQLRALSPAAVLERGFSVTYTADGGIIRTTDQVKPGDLVSTRLALGSIESSIMNINPGGKNARKTKR